MENEKKEEPCKNQGDNMVACIEKRKFVPPCIGYVILWDLCMDKHKKSEQSNKQK